MNRLTITPVPEFAQRPSAKHESDACCFLSPRERVRVRGKYSLEPAKRSISQRLRRRALVLLWVCFSLHSLLAQTTNAPASIATLAELQTRINEHLRQPRFAPALWGVKIVSFDSGKTLFEHNAGKLFKNTLSGYVSTAAGERLAFALMLNAYDAEGKNSVKHDLDPIAVLLAEFRGRSE